MQGKNSRMTTPPKRGRGRPRIHREAWTKVSVVLFERQVLALDRFTMGLRSKSGVSLTRAEVIRALLDGLHQSHLDLSAVRSGADLKRVVVNKLS